MRPEPQESLELMMLRHVMHKPQEKDDPNDLALASYRQKRTESFEWAQKQLQLAEKDYRAELAAWHKECREEERAAKQDKAESPSKGKKDIGTAKALEMLDKLIGELTTK